jgi:hypothetical protein
MYEAAKLAYGKMFIPSFMQMYQLLILIFIVELKNDRHSSLTTNVSKKELCSLGSLNMEF